MRVLSWYCACLSIGARGDLGCTGVAPSCFNSDAGCMRTCKGLTIGYWPAYHWVVPVGLHHTEKLPRHVRYASRAFYAHALVQRVLWHCMTPSR